MYQEILDKYDIDESKVLEHHGVKGQKWGVRKKSGAIRSIKDGYRQNKASKDRENKFITGYKKRGSKSTAQLKKELERLRLEAEYKNLTDQMINSNAKKRKERIQTAKTALDLATKGYDAYKKARKQLG